MAEETTKEVTRAPAPGCLRRALPPAILVLVTAALVAAPMYFLLYRPLAEEHRAVQSALAAAEVELTDLRPLVSENRVLQSSLDHAETKGLALQALVYVNDARVAIALGDPTGARMPILLTDSLLASLGSRLDPAFADRIEAMRNRVALARAGIESDAFAAQRDLEVLANDLSKLAKDLGQA
jgi:hypothetical protein